MAFPRTPRSAFCCIALHIVLLGTKIIPLHRPEDVFLCSNQAGEDTPKHDQSEEFNAFLLYFAWSTSEVQYNTYCSPY